MIKILFLTFLIFSCSLGFKISPITPPKSCQNTLIEGGELLTATFENNDANHMIESMGKILMFMSNILDSCIGEQVGTIYRNEMSQQCIVDLEKASKLGVKIMNEKEDYFNSVRDIFLLEGLVEKQVKQDCVLLKNLSLQNLTSGGICMESAYKLSLLFQQLMQDEEKGDKQAMMKDIDAIFTMIPDTLDACGQSDWANKFRKLFPMNCVHSLEDLVQELGILEHNYDHLQWLVKHYKQVIEPFKKVKANCPF